MSYCRIHGEFNEYYNGCPDCQKAENEVKNSLADIARARTHPGDFECPHCRYISLKRQATRCPLCQGDIRGDYWARVESEQAASAERRRTAAQAAREQRERELPAKERQVRNERIQTDMITSGIIALIGGCVFGLAKMLPSGSVEVLYLVIYMLVPFIATLFVSLVLGMLGLRNGLSGILVGAIMMGLGGAAIGVVLGFFKGCTTFHNGHTPSLDTEVWRETIGWAAGIGAVVGALWGSVAREMRRDD